MKKLISALLSLFLCLSVASLAEDSLDCDTEYNGCAGLPICWTVDSESGVAGYEIFLNGKSVYSKSTGEDSFSYTPEKGGLLTLICTLRDGTTLQSNEISIQDGVFFGRYEQDDVLSNGEEPIEWTVLAVEGGKALLISKYILHNAGYFNPWWIKYKYTYWAHSYIGDFNVNYWGSQPESASRRFTVNGPDDILMEDRSRGKEEDLYNSELHCRYWCNSMFYEDAFSDAEKERILLTHNVNPDNPDSKVDGGPDTDDYVFFLSYEEVQKYMKTADSRKCKQTKAALNEGKKNEASYWWLRTPGQFRVNAVIVYGNNGHTTLYGTDVGHDSIGYRPCVWITIGG